MSVPKTPVDQTHAPRNLTLAENIVLTLKLLGGLGLLGAALWLGNLWTAVE
jgi:hypothetical protein